MIVRFDVDLRPLFSLEVDTVNKKKKKLEPIEEDIGKLTKPSRLHRKAFGLHVPVEKKKRDGTLISDAQGLTGPIVSNPPTGVVVVVIGRVPSMRWTLS